MLVKGAFIKYDIFIEGNKLILTVKEGFTENAEDVFLLAWYAKEYI